MNLSIIIPVLNEAEGIAATLAALAPLRRRGHEVIVVDGGSQDATAARAADGADRVLLTPRGRARQMNDGAAVARHGVLLFLHADTVLPPGAEERLLAAVARGSTWGRFDVDIVGRSVWFPVIGALMNARSRLTGIATGDQAIFVTRERFEQVRGYPDQPLMEDIELSVRLRALDAPACLHERVRTSGRRWERHGVARTVLLMWQLRLAYALGVPPERLARSYR